MGLINQKSYNYILTIQYIILKSLYMHGITIYIQSYNVVVF